jgi:hypothetical protein
MGSISLAVTGTTANAALSGGGPRAVITNVGSVVAYISFGTAGVTATTASHAILEGTQVVFSVPEDTAGNLLTHIAAISDGNATTLKISTGEGI